MNIINAIFGKEIKDALRDRRTVMMVLFSALLSVPLMLMIFSVILSQVESQEERRVVMAVNIESARGLENYIQRQGYQLEVAPPDYEQKLRDKDLSRPVLLIPKDFDALRAQGKKAALEIVYDEANNQPQAQVGNGALRRLLSGYNQEVATFDLIMRGVSPRLLNQIEIKERHVSRGENRAGRLTAMLPFYLIIAIAMGGMFAAIDTMAGERERGSLEPLLMNPVSGWQLALGKWGAVLMLCVLVVVLTVLSFFPAQWLIRNETLRAQFQFGLPDALNFLMVLLPLAACISALQVAISMTCKTYKEAQVRNQLFYLLIALAPVVAIFNAGREPIWFQWVPVLAQNLMMTQMLKGEAPGAFAIAAALGMCALLTLAALWYVARKVRKVAML